MSVVIHQGDCRAVLAGLSADSVDAVVTDPPYHLASIVKRFGAADAAPAKSNGATGVYERASAGFMGKKWDGGDIAFQAETWAAVLRVLKPGGHMVAFGAPKNAHRLTCAIEDAGLEIRDRVVELIETDTHVARFLNSLTPEQADAFLLCLDDSAFGPELQWVFGTGFPKSLDVSKAIDKAAGVARKVVGTEKVRDIRNGNGRGLGDGINAANRDGPVYMDRELTEPGSDDAARWRGWGTALKPAYEPIILARKPLIGTVAENVLRHGTGALNIDGCRVEAVTRPLIQSDRRLEHNTYSPGLGGSKAMGSTSLGRWPANIVHDGSDEVLEAFPDAPGQQGALTGNEPSTSFSGEYVYGKMGRSRPSTPRGGSGSAARFFYQAKAGKADRNGSKHPTVKPIALMRYLCRLITPPGGVVLDPFAGSGTTGQAATDEGFDAVLIEREDEYIADIRRRFGVVPSLESMLA